MTKLAVDNSQDIKCNLCGAAGYILVHEKPRAKTEPAKAREAYRISESHLEKPEKVIRCMTCGMVYAVDKSTAAELAGEYAEMVDHQYLKEEKGRRQQARHILREIAKLKRGGKLLDIGCGPGLFLDEARKEGWDALGLDLSTWAQKWGKEHYGVDIVTGTLEEASFPSGSFDVVVMLDVIEHLKDPKATLTELRRILKTGGIFCVSTPDIESFWSRLLKARWWGINKYHLFYFSEKTLKHLFELVGFKSARHFAYPRIFSLRYWAKRLKPYPAFVSRPVRWLAHFRPLGSSLLKVDLNDQIAVLARKVNRLDTVGDDGESGSARETSAVTKQKVTVVLPAYNAARTLKRTVHDIPGECVDEIILVDDKSGDDTVKIARELGLEVFPHERNLGYGGNQKTCYEKAVERGADIVIMVHPDYQYDPKVIPNLIEPILRGEADAVFGSRMMKGGALEGGMPLWKYNANILLTAVENIILGTYLTEYHSGFRAYRTSALKRVRFKENSDGFVFDTEIIVQLLANRFKIEEIPIRTRYFEEASTIRLWPSILYGFNILWVMTRFILHSKGIFRFRQFEPA